MTITPLQYVQREFSDESIMTTEDWLRKMQEFAVLQNSKVPIEGLLSLEYEQKNALRSAINALYFNDRSNYKTALIQVVHHLTKIPYCDLSEEVIKSIYYLFEPS